MSLFYEDDIFSKQCTNLTYGPQKLLTIYTYYTHLHCKIGRQVRRVDARAALMYLGSMLLRRRPNAKRVIS